MTAPYKFGFPSRLTAISFPGRPRIVTVEAQAITVNPGNYSYNGEPFFFAGPLGTGSSGIAPGPAGAIGFRKPPATAPAIVQPFSPDMLNRLYSWEQPPHGYINANQTIGAGAIFVDLDNVLTLSPKAKTIQFEVDTKSHGSSTPPPAPVSIWYLYLTGLGQPFPGAFVNATGDINTQSFRDNSGLLPPTIDPTQPSQVSEYGSEVGGVCDMYFGDGPVAAQYLEIFGVPFSPGPSTEAEANIEIDNLITIGATEPGYVSTFQWMVTPPLPPGGAECSWSLKVNSWRRANNFVVTNTGVILLATIVDPKGKTFEIAPTKTQMLVSGGGNPKACRNIITVAPGSMQFSVLQRFF